MTSDRILLQDHETITRFGPATFEKSTSQVNPIFNLVENGYEIHTNIFKYGFIPFEPDRNRRSNCEAVQPGQITCAHLICSTTVSMCGVRSRALFPALQQWGPLHCMLMEFELCTGGYGHSDRGTRLEMHSQLVSSALEITPTVEGGPHTGDRVMAQDVWTAEDGPVYGDRAQAQYARSARPKPSLNRRSEDWAV
ncbi:hypothetical protein VNO78_00097 [Psophocarpus tetragonolobus]|uniref:Uncharacterized protein n=1 Tax=Psophocarpus tetragonolobus TaxID=3891 RepID=A0AAN9XUS2_PSOTE